MRLIPESAREFLGTVKVEHTVFALPFAYMTLFLVERGWPSWPHIAWVTVAMVAARTFGMAANRLIDADIDRHNPRTSARAIPAGRLGRAPALGYTALALAVFVAAVWQLHPICRQLWPVVIVAMVVYPTAKRFTWAAHLFLGAVYLMIPTAVWLAVSGALSGAALALGVGAALWVAGFDVIYACQDAEHDRRQGLHSMPADLGVAPALRMARVFHGGFVACLLYAGVVLETGWLYYAGLGVAAALLAYEHWLVRGGDLSRVGPAFFTMNGVLSVVVFVSVAADTVF